MDIATVYFREIHRVLQPGGSLMIHLPICVWPCGTGTAIPVLYRVRKTAYHLWARINRYLISRFNLQPIMKMTSYPVDYLFKTLSEDGFVDIDILMFLTKINDGLHPFVFAKKKGSLQHRMGN
jgi:SAM-dependent methyltransferase